MKARGEPWQLRKAAYWKTHDRVCVKCGYGTRPRDENRRVVLHHVKYGVRIGLETDGQLMALCPDCHNGVHRLASRAKLPVWVATYRFIPGAPEPESNDRARRMEQELSDDFDAALARAR